MAFFLRKMNSESVPPRDGLFQAVGQDNPGLVPNVFSDMKA